MNKYWYVVQNETNKTKKEYLIGFCYGNPECDESTILESMQSYCKSKAYRLPLLPYPWIDIQTRHPGLYGQGLPRYPTWGLRI